MAEYIDRDKLYIEVAEKYYDITAGSYPFNVVAHDMAQLVKNAPTEDVVPVVRCKDCVYWEGRGYDGRCEGYHNGLMRDYTNYDDYCSYGERRCGE